MLSAIPHFARPLRAASTWSIAFLTLCAMHPLVAGPVSLPAGGARGTFAPKKNAAVNLTSAVAFVDEKDQRKPVILILSDVKLPAEKWTGEFDLMRSRPTFTGVAFWLDKDGKVFRTDIYRGGSQSSVSGYFELKLDAPVGKDLSGTAITTDTDAETHKLDASFHATIR